MKNILKFLMLIILFHGMTVHAHPGRTDSYGCHTCKTNCESYGLSYGEYHCHNGSSNSNNSSATQKTTQKTTRTTTKKTTQKTTSVTTIKKPEIYGCTNKDAINYNEEATITDSSCQFEKITTTTESIPFETKTIGEKNDNSRVIQQGELGLKEIKEIKIIDENNNVISSKIEENIIKAPEKEIIEYQETTAIIAEIDEIDDADSFFVLLILFVPYLIPIIYSKKHSQIFLIINFIKKYNSNYKYLFYILYLFNPLILVIDIILIIKDKLAKK